jgi:type VI secretion system secreted protein Hcp
MSFYLQIKNINGAVTTKGHENWISLKSFDFATLRHITVKPGHVTDREGGVPGVGEFVVRKFVDKSSPYLLEAGCTSISLGQVTMDACGSSGDSDKYLQYILNDVIVSKYDINGVADDALTEKPIETLHLNFTKIEMKYTPRNSDNKALAPISAGYDIEKATKL